MAAKGELSDAERMDWLRLARSANVGPVAFRQLLERFGTPAAALDALPRLARRGGGKRTIARHSRSEAEREIARLAKLGGRLVALCEPSYPEALAALADPPPLLSLLGEPALPARPSIAVVGARNASANGLRLAERLAGELGEAGFAVVSGMARGIDARAHQGALETGTTAVLGGGVDVVYPRENRALYDRLREQGAIVSETALGTAPLARHFPRRNRIVSGLSRGVVVVEAAVRSGSLITARFALEQGRDVFAVPGSPLDPRARGPNDLIRQGASLVESADDVLNALGGPPSTDAERRSTRAPAARPGAALEEDAPLDAQAAVLALLGAAPAPVDRIVRESRLTPAAVATILLELELAGRVERQPGSLISLTGSEP